MTAPDLDAWAPNPQVRTRHRREAAADAEALWRAARDVRLSDTGTIGRLVRWRIPGVPPEQTFGSLFSAEPFTVLAEGEHWSISGLCGRIWTLARDYGCSGRFGGEVIVEGRWRCRRSTGRRAR